MSLLVGSSFSQNQGYENVLKTDSTTWILYHGELEYYMKDLVYVLKKNDTNYLYFWAGYEFLPYVDFVGTVREENGHLWFAYKEDTNNEVLVMDMNLEVGDEFVFDEQNNIIATVSEIRYENGRKIIVFDKTVYHWFNEPLMFVEGVGRNILGFPLFNDFDRSYQACKFDGQEQVYSTSNPHFENCELITTFVNDYTDYSSLKIYPNPAKNDFKINPDDLQQPYVVNIFNSNGVLVKTLNGVGETLVFSEQLENGLYLLELIYCDKILNRKLVIDK